MFNGKGKMTEGEGVANFARAFQHAGARSVVVRSLGSCIK